MPTTNKITTRFRTRPELALPTVPPIRLVVLPDAPDAAGEARVGLLVPPAPAAVCRRPVLHLFATIGAAVAAKGSMEAAQ